MLRFSANFLDIDQQIDAKQHEVDFLNGEVSVWLAQLQRLQDIIRNQEQELAKYLVRIDPSLLSKKSYVTDKLLLEPIVVVANCDAHATRAQKLAAAQNAVLELKMQLKQLQDKFTKAEEQSLSLELELVAYASTLLISEIDTLKTSRNLQVSLPSSKIDEAKETMSSSALVELLTLAVNTKNQDKQKRFAT